MPPPVVGSTPPTTRPSLHFHSEDDFLALLALNPIPLPNADNRASLLAAASTNAYASISAFKGPPTCASLYRRSRLNNRTLASSTLPTNNTTTTTHQPTPTACPPYPRVIFDVPSRATNVQPVLTPLLILMLLPLVAAVSVGVPRNICVPTRILPSNDPLITTNNVEPTIHSRLNVVHRHPNPQTAHDIPNAHSNHLIAIIRWCSLLTLATYLILVKWYQAYQTSQLSDQTPQPSLTGNEFDNTAPRSFSSSRTPTLSGPVQAPSPSPAYSSPPVQTRSVAGTAAKHTSRPLRSGLARARDDQQPNGPSAIFEPRPRRSNAWPTVKPFEPRPPRSTRAIPLLATLCASLDAHFLFSRIKWFILIVAVSTDTVPDPKFDLAFLQKVFESSVSTGVCLEWLNEEDATPENIQVRLRSLHRKVQEAGVPSQVLIYLTGMGDGSSRLCIPGDKTVTEQDIGGWLADLRAESVRPQAPLRVFIDICRESMERLDPADYNLALVWSCSVGQLAYAIKLGEGLPNSFFLIALFSACHDVQVDSDIFEKAFIQAFTRRMDDLEEYLKFIYHKWHEGSQTCNNCPDGGKCPQPGSQEPELDDAGQTALVHLGKLIGTEYPDHARKVADALARSMDRSGFSKLRNTNPPAPFSLKAGFASQKLQPKAQHFRGANKPALQAEGFPMWCQ